ncbi:hypothetical protein SH2C18_14930 [Clostridium sediminicola]|uniref:CPBP family intramembrane glutamic endopeptidase n=1 Tax=Clostridium sediminicola TaxID=3114879 RepID=UPI0031F27F9B
MDIIKKFNKKVIVFILLVFVLTSFSYYKIISTGTLEGNEQYVFIAMWMPAISAFITKIIFDRNLKGLGWKIGKLKYQGISYAIPLFSGLVVYSIAWISGIGGLDLTTIGINNVPTGITKFLLFATLGVMGSAISAVGEEIGWRGFLVPELLKKYSYTKTSIIVAVIWNLYHYPFLLFSDYNNGVSIGLSLVAFTISIFAVCFITTWLRIKSGSLWTGVIIHASHNLFIQAVFDPITIDKGYTKMFTTEFGIGLAIVYAIIAFYFWKRRGLVC